jgi:hypothetical protein
MLIHGHSLYDVTAHVWCVVIVINITGPILGPYAKLRKATFSYVLSVCLCTWDNSTPTEQIFMKRIILVFFQNISKNQVYLKSDKNNG